MRGRWLQRAVGVGSLMGLAVPLAVAPMPAVAAEVNDDFVDAAPLDGATGFVATTVVDVSYEDGERRSAPGHLTGSAWYRIQAPEDGTLHITNVGHRADMAFAISTGPSAGEQTYLAAAYPDATSRRSWFTLDVPVEAGATYFISVEVREEPAAGGAPIGLQWSFNPPPNNQAYAAQPLPGPSGRVTGSTARATADPVYEFSDRPVEPLLGSHDVWFVWTPTAIGTLVLTTEGSDVDTFLWVGRIAEEQVLILDDLAVNDDEAPGSTHSRIELPVDLGHPTLRPPQYYIAVSGQDRAAGDVVLSYAFTPDPDAGPPPIEVSVIASESTPVDTGMVVEQGQVVEFSTSGTWCLGRLPFECGGGDGIRPANPEELPLILDSAPIGALIGRAGTGPWFLIGAGGGVRMPSSGPLVLVFNDRPCCYGDNRGLLTVTAALAPRAWVEDGDAEGVPWVAQVPRGEARLQHIHGTIREPHDDDLFRVCLTGDGSFSATATGSIDLQLVLLDANGRGVMANDDASTTTSTPVLPAGHPLTPVEPGVYHLGVSGWDNDPVGRGGGLFPNNKRGVVGPTGPGGNDRVLRWNSHGRAGTGTYQLSLTGAEFCSA